MDLTWREIALCAVALLMAGLQFIFRRQLSSYDAAIAAKADKVELAAFVLAATARETEAHASRQLIHEKLDANLAALHATALICARLEGRSGDIDRLDEDMRGVRQRLHDLSDSFQAKWLKSS